jgi:hypothetical protein
MTRTSDYMAIVGDSWKVVRAWRRDHPNRPFVGVRADGEGWVAVEPKTSTGSLRPGIIGRIEHILQATDLDTWVADSVILCRARNLR